MVLYIEEVITLIRIPNHQGQVTLSNLIRPKREKRNNELLHRNKIIGSHFCKAKLLIFITPHQAYNKG